MQGNCNAYHALHCVKAFENDIVEEMNVTLLLKTSRYACSGFSLIGFYLVTVLEEANVALPPLQVIFIIMVTASLS